MKNEILIKGVFFDSDGNKVPYFGHCYYKEHKNFTTKEGKEKWFINKYGGGSHTSPDVWFYCPICKIRWCIGNIISSTGDDWDKIKDFDDFTAKGINLKDFKKRG